MTRLHAELFHQQVAFANAHLGLLVGRIHLVEPKVYRGIKRCLQHLSPLWGEVVAVHLVLARRSCGANNGEREVQVGVFKAAHHGTSGAFAARSVAFCMAFAKQVRGKSQAQGQLSAARRAAEHQRMGQTVVVHHAYESTFNVVLPNYVVPVHNSFLATSQIESTADTV